LAFLAAGQRQVDDLGELGQLQKANERESISRAEVEWGCGENYNAP